MICAALQNDIMEFLCLFFDFLGARLRSRQKDERYPKGSGNAMDVIIQASVIEGGFRHSRVGLVELACPPETKTLREMNQKNSPEKKRIQVI